MKELILDATSWQNSDDVYDAIFRAVGAPEWHGRNFNALRDSIATGFINRVEIPYRIVVKHSGTMGQNAREMLHEFRQLIEELAAEGCQVQIRIEG
jgi:RNAse (barnase) inhibitor barstar